MVPEIEFTSCKEIRARARTTLSQNLKHSILFNILFFVIFILAAIVFDEELWGFDETMGLYRYCVVLAIFNLGFYVITGPLPVGYSEFFLLRSRGVKCGFGVMFNGYKQFFRNLITIFVADLIYYGLFFLAGLLSLILFSVFMVGESSILKDIALYGIFSDLKICIPLILFFVLCLLIFLKTYALICLLTIHLADNPEMGTLEVIKTLWVKTKNCNFQMIKLCFSFIGWWLLCAITLGIAAIWVIPYWNYARAEFYKDLFKQEPLEETSVS